VASAAIDAAARRLSIRLVDHELVLARATGSVGRLDGKLGSALTNGALQDFNREYRRRRIAARGARFPPYNTALAKLRAAIAGSLAGTPLSAEVMKGVFEDG
jgi:hypothetical protein